MFDIANLGRILVIAGLGLAAVGAILWGLSRTSLPVGELPGDFQFEFANVSCFVPLATMIIVSVIATVLLNVIIRFLSK